MSRAKDIIETLVPLHEDKQFLEALMPLVNLAILMEARDSGEVDVEEPDFEESPDDAEIISPDRTPGMARLGSRKHGDTLPVEQTQELVTKNIPLAYHLAKVYSNTPGVSRDEIVTQALSALDRAARYYDPEKCPSFGAFAGRIIRNELNRYFKDEMTIKTHEFTDLDTPAHEDDEGESGETAKDQIADPFHFGNDMDSREKLQALQRAIKSIDFKDPRHRQALEMSMQGIPYREIAKTIGTSHVNVGHWMNKIFTALRKEMRNDGFDVPPDEEINPATGRPHALKGMNKRKG